MRSTRQLSITLPNEMAELVRAKVATGQYATEGEVIRDGLLSCSQGTASSTIGCARRSPLPGTPLRPIRLVGYRWAVCAQRYRPSTGKLLRRTASDLRLSRRFEGARLSAVPHRP